MAKTKSKTTTYPVSQSDLPIRFLIAHSGGVHLEKTGTQFGELKII